MWTGSRLRRVRQDVVELTARQFAGGGEQTRSHFEALKRVLDRDEPDYRD